MSLIELNDDAPHSWANLRVNNFTVDDTLTVNHLVVNDLTVVDLTVTHDETVGHNLSVGNTLTVVGDATMHTIEFDQVIAQTPLDFYKEMDYAVNYDGIYNSPVASEWHFTRIGNMVTFQMQEALAVHSGADIMTFSVFMDAEFVPKVPNGGSGVYSAIVPVINNSSTTFLQGTLKIFTGSNTVTITFPGATTGNCGIPNLSVSYIAGDI